MNTQQRQLLARNRRRREQVQQRWQQLHNTRSTQHFSSLGIYNVVMEEDHVGNAERLRLSRTPVEFGDHWLTWSAPDGRTFVARQQEIVRANREGQIISITYRSDHINFDLHSIQRLWQRTGQGLPEQDYPVNLDIPGITDYFGNLGACITQSPLLESGEWAIRQDIPLPYRGGLFLGSVRVGEGSITITSQGVKASPHQLKYCAHTYVAGHQLTESQRKVRDLILQGDLRQARQQVQSRTWLIEAFDPRQQHQTWQQQIRSTMPLIDQVAGL